MDLTQVARALDAILDTYSDQHCGQSVRQQRANMERDIRSLALDIYAEIAHERFIADERESFGTGSFEPIATH